MKFKAKLSTLLSSFNQAYICSTVGAQRDYADTGKVTLVAKDNQVVALANNGHVAIEQVILPSGTKEFEVETDGEVTLNSSDLLATLKAFSPEEVCSFTVVNFNFIVEPVVSDDEQKQTIPTEAKPVVMPTVTKQFDNVFKIDRQIFLNAVNTVQYALTQERFKQHFRFWKMLVQPDYIRTVAGCGSRFDIYEYEAPGFITTKNKSLFFLSSDHSQSVLKILASSLDPTIEIAEKKAPKSDYADQVVIKVLNTTIIAIGFIPDKKWPDENKFLTRASTSRFITNTGEWKYIVAGFEAVDNAALKNVGQTHYVSFNFDGNKNKVAVKSTHAMSSSRTVKLKDAVGQVDFRSVAGYFSDLFNKADVGTNIQFEFTTPIEPVVARLNAADKVSDGPFYKINATNSSREQRTILIAPASTKS